MNGMTVCGESDVNLGRVRGAEVSNEVSNVFVVCQHKTVVNVSTENK